MKFRILPLLVGLIVGVPSVTSAQQHRATVIETAPIYLTPNTNRTPLRTASVQTELRMLADEGDWLKVEFHDPQFGQRVGYIESRRVRVHRADLEPMDLSVRELVRTADAPVAAPQQNFERQQRPQFERPADPLASALPNLGRVWIDVNLGMAATAAKAETFTFVGTMFQEGYGLGVSYPKPSTGASFDFGGGYLFSPRVGVGINFTGTAHQNKADLGIIIPHPHFFDSEGADASETEEQLVRQEGTANIQLMLAPVHSDRVRVRMFGGPSFFRYKADMVQDIGFSQFATPFSRTNLVAITRYQAENAEATAWGVHVGGDVSWFFTRVVGIGAFARYSYAGATLDPEPMSEERQDIKLGGFQTGGGLRLRF